MQAFEFSNYRSFLLTRLKGRGALARIAAELKVHPSLISKVLNGSHHFTPDQAFQLAEHLELIALEKDYFLALVDYERSGNPRHRAWLKTKLAQLRAEAEKTTEPGGSSTGTLSDRNQFIFYSHWYYSAARLLTGIGGGQTPEAIAALLGIPLPMIEEVASFLVSTGLCTQSGGRLMLGVRDTRIETDSPMIDRHLSNWRMKALERIPRSAPEKSELFYSGPMAIHRSLRPRVRALILELIEEVSRARETREPEELACLNIDWFAP